MRMTCLPDQRDPVHLLIPVLLTTTKALSCLSSRKGISRLSKRVRLLQISFTRRCCSPTHAMPAVSSAFCTQVLELAFILSSGLGWWRIRVSLFFSVVCMAWMTEEQQDQDGVVSLLLLALYNPAPATWTAVLLNIEAHTFACRSSW